MEFDRESLCKLIDRLESFRKPNGFTFFVYSEEVKKLLNEYFPGEKVVIIPETDISYETNNNKIFIIPTYSTSPINVRFVGYENKED